MPTSLKLLGLLLIIQLTSCRSTILHKESVRETITEPIVKSIDKLELNKLIDSSKESVDLSKETLKKLTDTLNELKELASNANSTFVKIAPEIEQSAKNIKSLTSKLDALDSGKDSIIWKIVPILMLVLSVLISVLLIKKYVKKI